ncbi:hypothetical protein ACFL38_02010 [Candidatus Omnitrophota bacterium]
MRCSQPSQHRRRCLLSKRCAQSIISFAFIFMAIAALALGIVRIWTWYNINFAKRADDYQDSRLAAGGGDPSFDWAEDTYLQTTPHDGVTPFDLTDEWLFEGDPSTVGTISYVPGNFPDFVSAQEGCMAECPLCVETEFTPEGNPILVPIPDCNCFRQCLCLANIRPRLAAYEAEYRALMAQAETMRRQGQEMRSRAGECDEPWEICWFAGFGAITRKLNQAADRLFAERENLLRQATDVLNLRNLLESCCRRDTEVDTQLCFDAVSEINCRNMRRGMRLMWEAEIGQFRTERNTVDGVAAAIYRDVTRPYDPDTTPLWQWPECQAFAECICSDPWQFVLPCWSGCADELAEWCEADYCPSQWNPEWPPENYLPFIEQCTDDCIEGGTEWTPPDYEGAAGCYCEGVCIAAGETPPDCWECDDPDDWVFEWHCAGGPGSNGSDGFRPCIEECMETYPPDDLPPPSQPGEFFPPCMRGCIGEMMEACGPQMLIECCESFCCSSGGFCCEGLRDGVRWGWGWSWRRDPCRAYKRDCRQCMNIWPGDDNAWERDCFEPTDHCDCEWVDDANPPPEYQRDEECIVPGTDPPESYKCGLARLETMMYARSEELSLDIVKYNGKIDAMADCCGTGPNDVPPLNEQLACFEAAQLFGEEDDGGGPLEGICDECAAIEDPDDRAICYDNCFGELEPDDELGECIQWCNANRDYEDRQECYENRCGVPHF